MLIRQIFYDNQKNVFITIFLLIITIVTILTIILTLLPRTSLILKPNIQLHNNPILFPLLISSNHALPRTMVNVTHKTRSTVILPYIMIVSLIVLGVDLAHINFDHVVTR